MSEYPDCPSCDETLGTNGHCLECVSAYEAGIGPQAERDGVPDGYVPPSSGGCWICMTADEDDEIAFDTEFDTFYHPECLEDAGYETILEYERRFDDE